MSKLQLESKNLGKPTCPDVILNPKKASATIPQAWESNGNWYYNHPGALAEAKSLGKKIPTKEQWEELYKIGYSNIDCAYGFSVRCLKN